MNLILLLASLWQIFHNALVSSEFDSNSVSAIWIDFAFLWQSAEKFNNRCGTDLKTIPLLETIIYDTVCLSAAI